LRKCFEIEKDKDKKKNENYNYIYQTGYTNKRIYLMK
jgi:hypothetical protein